jgi:hypothetical protein
MRTPSRTKHFLMVLVAASLLATSAAAAGLPTIALLQAESLALDGDSIISGALGVVVHEPSLEASDLAMELDVRTGVAKTQVLHSFSAAGLVTNGEERYVDEADAAGILHGTTTRPQYYLGLFADGAGATIQVTAADARLRASPETEIAGHIFMRSEIPQPRHRTGGEAQLESATGPIGITVTGSFLLMLWELDLAKDGSETRFETGSQDAPAHGSLPAESSRAAGERTDRQLYLYVTDGSLQLWSLDPDAFKVHIGAPAIETAGTATFTGASAKVADGSNMRSVEPGTMTFDGQLRIESTGPTTHRMPMRVSGTSRSVVVNGEALSWAAPIEVVGPSGNSLWPLLIFGFVATPGLVAGGVYGHRWTQTARMNRLEDLMEWGEWDAVARKAPRLSRSRHFGLDAMLMRVDALVRLGRLDEALQAAKTLRAPTETGQALVEFTLAYLHAARGDTEKAVGHALACVNQGPEFREYLRTFPEFAALRSDPRLRGVVPREPPRQDPPGYA